MRVVWFSICLTVLGDSFVESGRVDFVAPVENANLESNSKVSTLQDKTTGASADNEQFILEKLENSPTNENHSPSKKTKRCPREQIGASRISTRSVPEPVLGSPQMSPQTPSDRMCFRCRSRYCTDQQLCPLCVPLCPKSHLSSNDVLGNAQQQIQPVECNFSDGDSNSKLYTVAKLQHGPQKKILLSQLAVKDVSDIDKVIVLATTKSGKSPDIQIKKAERLDATKPLIQQRMSQFGKQKSNLAKQADSPQGSQGIQARLNPESLDQSDTTPNFPRHRMNPDVIEGPIDPDLLGAEQKRTGEASEQDKTPDSTTQKSSKIDQSNPLIVEPEGLDDSDDDEEETVGSDVVGDSNTMQVSSAGTSSSITPEQSNVGQSNPLIVEPEGLDDSDENDEEPSGSIAVGGRSSEQLSLDGGKIQSQGQLKESDVQVNDKKTNVGNRVGAISKNNIKGLEENLGDQDGLRSSDFMPKQPVNEFGSHSGNIMANNLDEKAKLGAVKGFDDAKAALSNLQSMVQDIQKMADEAKSRSSNVGLANPSNSIGQDDKLLGKTTPTKVFENAMSHIRQMIKSIEHLRDEKLGAKHIDGLTSDHINNTPAIHGKNEDQNPNSAPSSGDDVEAFPQSVLSRSNEANNAVNGNNMERSEAYKNILGQRHGDLKTKDTNSVDPSPPSSKTLDDNAQERANDQESSIFHPRPSVFIPINPQTKESTLPDTTIVGQSVTRPDKDVFNVDTKDNSIDAQDRTFKERQSGITPSGTSNDNLREHFDHPMTFANPIISRPPSSNLQTENMPGALDEGRTQPDTNTVGSRITEFDATASPTLPASLDNRMGERTNNQQQSFSDPTNGIETGTNTVGASFSNPPTDNIPDASTLPSSLNNRNNMAQERVGNQQESSTDPSVSVSPPATPEIDDAQRVTANEIQNETNPQANIDPMNSEGTTSATQSRLSKLFPNMALQNRNARPKLLQLPIKPKSRTSGAHMVGSESPNNINDATPKLPTSKTSPVQQRILAPTPAPKRRTLQEIINEARQKQEQRRKALDDKLRLQPRGRLQEINIKDGASAISPQSKLQELLARTGLKDNTDQVGEPKSNDDEAMNDVDTSKGAPSMSSKGRFSERNEQKGNMNKPIVDEQVGDARREPHDGDSTTTSGIETNRNTPDGVPVEQAEQKIPAGHQETTVGNNLHEQVGSAPGDLKNEDVSESMAGDQTLGSVAEVSTENNWSPNLGKIVQSSKPSDVFFLSHGIKIPLQVSHDEKGNMNLQVDLDRLCKCKNGTCPTHTHVNISETVGAILEKEAELKEQIDSTMKESQLEPNANVLEDDSKEEKEDAKPMQTINRQGRAIKKGLLEKYLNSKRHYDIMKRSLNQQPFLETTTTNNFFKTSIPLATKIEKTSEVLNKNINDAKEALSKMSKNQNFLLNRPKNPLSLFGETTTVKMLNDLLTRTQPLIANIEKTSEILNNKLQHEAYQVIEKITVPSVLNKQNHPLEKQAQALVNQVNKKSNILPNKQGILDRISLLPRSHFNQGNDKFNLFSPKKSVYQYKKLEEELENKLQKLNEEVEKYNDNSIKIVEDGYNTIFKQTKTPPSVKEEIDIVSKILAWIRSIAVPEVDKAKEYII